MAALAIAEEAFFQGRPEALALYRALLPALRALGSVTRRVTKSQIALVRRRAFAWIWTPDRYLKGPVAPLVLSVRLARRDPSWRWKEVVEPRPGQWMHHLEVASVAGIDAEVRAWLQEAWDAAG